MNPFAYQEYKNNHKLIRYDIHDPLKGKEEIRKNNMDGLTAVEMKKMAMPNKTEKKAPVRKYRIGTVQLAVWENKGKDESTFNTYSIGISYYDEASKSYKDSSSMSKVQMANLQAIIGKCLMDEVFFEQKE